MFLCGLNLNKTMGSSIYGHKEVGIWRIFLSLDVVTIPYAHNQVETRQIRNEPRIN